MHHDIASIRTCYLPLNFQISTKKYILYYISQIELSSMKEIFKIDVNF